VAVDAGASRLEAPAVLWAAAAAVAAAPGLGAVACGCCSDVAAVWGLCSLTKPSACTANHSAAPMLRSITVVEGYNKSA
jgi:hypothetical protein